MNRSLKAAASKIALGVAAGAVLATSAPAFADPGWKHDRSWRHGGERHARERVVYVPAYPAYAVPAYPAPVVVERRVVVREPVFVAPPPHVYYAPPPPAVVVRGDMNTVGGAVIGAVIGGVIGSRM